MVGVLLRPFQDLFFSVSWILSGLRGVFRFLCIMVIMGAFILAVLFFRLFLSPGSIRERRVAAFMVQRFCQIVKWILGLHVTVNGKKFLVRGEPVLLAGAPHLSYLDILVAHAVLRRICFVTSKDMQERAFVGSVMSYGSVYGVERRNRNTIEKDIKAMQGFIEKGVRVMFYPEGKSHGCDELFRFKEPLFDSAVRAKARVIPMFLKVTRVGKKPFDLSTRDIFCWYKRENIFVHLFRFACVSSSHCELTFCPPIESEGKSSKQLSLEAHAAIKERFQPVGP